MKPLNSTLLGRVVIRLIINLGGLALIAFLLLATPAKVFAPFLAPVLGFGVWLAAGIYGAKPHDPNDG
jgi:hypothetical protein